MKSLYYKILAVALLTCTQTYSQTEPAKIIVPLGGNSWVTARSKNGDEKVTVKGWRNWQYGDAIFSTYIKVQRAGSLKLAAVMHVPGGESTLQWTINGISKTINVSGTADKEYAIGEWRITQPGYILITAQGLSKTGNLFADVNDLYLEGTATDSPAAFVKNNEGNYFYWGRRGPSVHINYDLAEVNEDVEWFYNEITVPEGNDVTGSYFMANGFAEGYFGMQVNSAKERRILFSVWSPFVTDNPKEIPENKKIQLLKKGDKVHAGEFGNEGSGGQSYLQYNWKAGETYKFLVHAKPTENNYTTYTAYFYAAEKKPAGSGGKWLLIASFNRPETNTYLKKLHSFLENFEPETGCITRKAYYHNQWLVTKTGEWKPVTKMLFTGDATANIGYRLDYSGGVSDGKFYLRNCGFFNDNTILKTKFSVSSTGKKPEIDFLGLEK
ncbi:MAG: DUF3472 domain-containing protein [Chitinophagaceae bacterium]|nr:DUF3472 domain-containing protein [Chitinophagaceae bacterium]